MPTTTLLTAGFAALPSACLLLTPDWHVVAVSDAYLAVSFTSREALVGQSLFDVFGGAPSTPEADTMSSLRVSLQQVLATGQPQSLPVQSYRLPDPTGGAGTMRYWQPLNSPVRDAAGALVGVLHTVVDVTTQHQAEMQLRESHAREQAAQAQVEAERQRLQQAIRHMPANIALLRGPAHVYELVNPAYERLFPGRPLLGRSLREALPELVGQGFYELFDRVYQTGEPFYADEVEAWADFAGTGELQRRYYRTAFEPLRDEQGQVTEILNFSVDVTAQVLARQQVEQLNRELAAAQAAAERQRGELRRVFEQAPLAIAVYRGPTYTIELANPTVCRLWGRRAEDIVGLGLFEALPEVAGMGYEELLDGVMATGTPHVARAMEAQHDRNGHRETVYWDFVYEPMYAEDGHIDGAMVVATEVTTQVLARRQLEQLNQELEARVRERTAQLAEQQDLLRQILRQVPAAIATLSGPAHRFSFANAQYQALVGHRATVGHRVAEALPEVVEQGVIELLDHVYQTGEPFIGREIVIMLEQPPGPPHHYHYDLTYLPLRDGQGQVQGLLVFAIDVTEQVRSRRQAATLQAELLATARRQVQEREEFYQIFTQIPTVVVQLRGPEHRIDYLNAATERLLPGRYLRGHSVVEGMPEADAQGFAALLDGVYHTGKTYLRTEVPLTVPDAAGQPVTTYLNFSYQAYREQGQVVGVSMFAYDVTEQVRAHQQVRDLNEQLAAINEELIATNEELHQSNAQLGRTNVDLGTFVYTASHDLKAPITNIEGLLAALRETLPSAVQQDEVVAHLLGLLDATVTRFLTTISQLTDLSRLQRAYEEPTEHLALAPVVAGVLADLAPQITEAGATLQVRVPTELHVSFAPASLRSIVYNLLSNAVKYRDPARPAQVQVQAERQPGVVVLTVQDNGLGLTEAQQQRLFQVFQRLHTHVEGTGVGLYMIKRLIENAGATIAATSAPGVGSTFTVTFPA